MTTIEFLDGVRDRLILNFHAAVRSVVDQLQSVGIRGGAT